MCYRVSALEMLYHMMLYAECTVNMQHIYNLHGMEEMGVNVAQGCNWNVLLGD